MEDLEFYFYSLVGIPSLIAAAFIGLTGHYVRYHRIGDYHGVIGLGSGLFVLGALLGILGSTILSSLILFDHYMLVAQANRILQGIGLLIFSYGMYKFVQEKSGEPSTFTNGKGPFF